jgi:hypothetical protein
MTENKNIHPASNESDLDDINLLDEEGDDIEQAFIEHYRTLFEGMKTEQDELIELYQSGQYEALNEKIDEKAIEATEKSDEYQRNLAEIKNLVSYRGYDKAAVKELVARQNELVAIHRNWIIIETGLPDDARFSQIEKAKNAITERLSAEHPNGYTPLEALQTLNIVSIDENNKRTYRFPEELVPESTNESWKTYLAAVCKHVKTQRDLSNHVIDDKSAVEQADTTRTHAHNAITKDMHAILGLEGNEKWDFLKTRELLAHIRDEIFPTIDSPLSNEGLALIDHQSAALDVIDCLCTRSTRQKNT